MTKGKGSKNQYDYIVNRNRRTMPPRVMVGDYNRSLMQMPKYYPQEFGDTDAKATTQTLMLIGGLVAVVAIVAYLGSRSPVV